MFCSDAFMSLIACSAVFFLTFQWSMVWVAPQSATGFLLRMNNLCSKFRNHRETTEFTFSSNLQKIKIRNFYY